MPDDPGDEEFGGTNTRTRQRSRSAPAARSKTKPLSARNHLKRPRRNREADLIEQKAVTVLNLSELFTKYSRKTWFGIGAVCFMSVITVALPLYFGGIRQTVDMESHLNFVHAYLEAISAGTFYPAWTSDNLGFGSVGTRFYPPATSFIQALIVHASGSWHFAFAASLFGWMPSLFGRVPVRAGMDDARLRRNCRDALCGRAVPRSECFRFSSTGVAGAAVLPFFLLYLTACADAENGAMCSLTVSASFSSLFTFH